MTTEQARKALQRALVAISRNRPSTEDTNTARRELNDVYAFLNELARPQPIVTTDGLVERLRSRKESVYCGEVQGMEWVRDELCQQAADRIASLERALTEALRGFVGTPEKRAELTAALSTTHPLNADEEVK